MGRRLLVGCWLSMSQLLHAASAAPVAACQLVRASACPSARACVTMRTRIAIVGLPNVGKSTLFNALAQQSIAQAANFPFCTIEPNMAPIDVPDRHLMRLGAFARSTRTVAASMDWVDVAGLAKGASRGEGLGNRFLAVIRECDAICHLVRVFDDPNIIHDSMRPLHH
ncbi:MAG: hypothetical protein SGPRY_011996 [Prymnesium sp.]